MSWSDCRAPLPWSLVITVVVSARRTDPTRLRDGCVASVGRRSALTGCTGVHVGWGRTRIVFMYMFPAISATAGKSCVGVL